MESPVDGSTNKTKAQAYGITSYGISMTTLEEVFLKLREDNSKEELKSITNSPNNNGNSNQTHPQLQANQFDFHLAKRLSGRNLAWQQILALLKIRLMINCRDPLSIFFRFFFPPVFIILGLIFANNIASITRVQRDPPVLKLTPELYLNTTATSPSQPFYSDLLLKNSTANSIDEFINYLHHTGLSYQMGNLSSHALLEDYPHTISYDVLQFKNTSGVSSMTLNSDLLITTAVTRLKCLQMQSELMRSFNLIIEQIFR